MIAQKNACIRLDAASLKTPLSAIAISTEKDGGTAQNIVR